MPKDSSDRRKALRQANLTDIVGSVDTRGIASRYDSPAKVAPLLDFYPEGDERDLGVAESVASTIGGSSHPYSKGHEEVKDPVIAEVASIEGDKEREDEAEGLVIDVTSDASGPDGVVEGSDAEESIEKTEPSDKEERIEDTAERDPLPEGWEGDWNRDQMLEFVQANDIEGVNTSSKKAELVNAIKRWEQKQG